jgi:hypothetical protein
VPNIYNVSIGKNRPLNGAKKGHFYEQNSQRVRKYYSDKKYASKIITG